MKDVAVPQTSAAITLCGSVRSWLISTHTEAGEALKPEFRGVPRLPEAGLENKNSMPRTQIEAVRDPNLYNTICEVPSRLEQHRILGRNWC